jgi:hypothetical protein
MFHQNIGWIQTEYRELWLRHYATSLKVAGSRSDEVNIYIFFSVYLILPAALDSGVYSVSNRN